MNALTHALAAETVVLTNESRRLFEEVMSSYASRFAPANPLEADLVEKAVNKLESTRKSNLGKRTRHFSG